jgi:hypothetical protein
MGIDRDAQESELARMLVQVLLPNWQLTAAYSPARPHEDEEAAPPVLPKLDGPSIDAW